MIIVKIKKKDFIKDYEAMSVDALKKKYSLNNRSFYKVVDELELDRKRGSSEHKKIVLI